ncbi:MAG: dihydrofolate reductase [Lactobacillus sp.]|jgi:dihydrofolate reductase|nr:dihydrofolate reductase [Lactobacillus sp.]
MLAFIWAESTNHVIGAKGKMPWHISDDLQYFKKTTRNHCVVMGRQTFVSLGGKPLPQRQNIVLSRQFDLQLPADVIHCQDKQGVLAYAKAQPTAQIFIIGGAQIFALFADVVQQLYVTRIQKEVPGDTYMPPLPWSEFKLISEVPGATNTDWPHKFEIYERI